MEELPPYLIEAIEKKRLLVFAGAGISVLSPSSLPDWRNFNEIILDEIKSMSLSSGFINKEIISAVSDLSLDNIGFKLFSEAIVKIIAGEAFFPVMQVLDSPYTNANHHSIAQLANQGIVQAIVTTNFDTLLERAFDEANIPLKVHYKPLQFSNPTLKDACTLYKIHGSVNNSSTLVDTVGQKLRGLHPLVSTRLAELFQQHHVLVVGYSGEDLSFGADYLSFSSLSPSSPGITWLVRSGTQPNSVVKEVVSKAGERGNIVVADLPEFFKRLSASEISHTEILPKVAKDTPGDGDLQIRIRKLLDFGHLQSIAFCMRMLLATEKFTEAKAVRELVITEIKRSKDYKSIGPVLRALAVTASINGGADEMEYWTQNELEYLDSRNKQWLVLSKKVEDELTNPGRDDLAKSPLPFPFEGNYTPNGWKLVNEKIEDEHYRLKTGALTNLALSYTSKGKISEAGNALQEALGCCEQCIDRVGLATVFFAYGVWCISAFPDPDLPLTYFQLAEAAGITSGNLDTVISSLLQQVNQFILFSEYDSAKAAIAKAKKWYELNPSTEVNVEFDRLSGIIEVRRNEFDKASNFFKQAIITAGTHQPLIARVECTKLDELCCHPKFTAEMKKVADKLIKWMDERSIPDDGAVDGILSLSTLQGIRSKLSVRNQEYERPHFLIASPETLTDEEMHLHYNLAVAEFNHEDMLILQNLRDLATNMFNEGRLEKSLRITKAYLMAAKRTGQQGDQITAMWIRGKIYYWMGDVDQYSKIFESIVSLKRESGTEPGAELYEELALVQWTLDNVKLAKQNAHAALSIFHSQGDSEKASSLQQLVNQIDSGEKKPLPAKRASSVVFNILERQSYVSKNLKEIERMAQTAFDQIEFGVGRVLLFEVMESYRVEHNYKALAGCFEILANAAKVEKRFDHADQLLNKAIRLKGRV